METVKDIFKEFGETIFRISLFNVMQSGMINYTDEIVDQNYQLIINNTRKNSLISPEFQCDVLRCTGRLSKCAPLDILKFVQKNAMFDEKNVECPKCGNVYMENKGIVDGGESLYIDYWTCPACGFKGVTRYRLVLLEEDDIQLKF